MNAFRLATAFALVSALSPTESNAAALNPCTAEIDEKLNSFCQMADRSDRGPAMTPLAGGADNFLLVVLTAEDVNEKVSAQVEGFRDWIGLTAEQRASIKSLHDKLSTEFRKKQYRLPATDDLPFMDKLDHDATPAREALESVFGDGQDAKLLASYLYIEGLMGLRRDPFVQRLDLSMYQQILLRAKTERAISKALPYHQAAFSRVAHNPAALKEVREQTRRISRELDKEVVEMLTAAQKRKLFDLLFIVDGIPRLDLPGSVESTEQDKTQ